MKREWIDTNRTLWDERVALHVGSDFYNVAAFKAGAPVLEPFELEHVGDVRGKSLVHLQCHFGLDTLDWARRGARVTGVDFSEPAVRAARALAADVGLPARFETANVYDAASVLGDTYDVVYTGQGALCWLPDLGRWAQVVSELLVPGGFLYLTEFHPVTDMMADDSFAITRDYFGRPEGYLFDDGLTYVETGERTASSRSFEWLHATSSVISSLLAAGLRLQLFVEHAFTVYKRFPFLERIPDAPTRQYRMPEGQPALPLMYSVRATKPAP
jgi:SAM-dependent methyltransferase